MRAPNVRLSAAQWITALVLATVAQLALSTSANGESIDELTNHFSDFQSNARSLYRLDSDDLDTMWDAYCGRFDPKIEEDRRFATDIGQQLQNKERGILEQLMGHDIPEMRKAAQEFIDNSGSDSDTKESAQNILEQLKKEEENLNRLYDGVVLKGSNHPFVQYAIEYGKQQHKEMCDRYGVSPLKICDQEYPGADGRPDLVTFDNGHLVIYEFKPDNSKAKDAGERQLERYLVAVVNYYQQYFVDGKNAGFKGEPSGDLGGKVILEKLRSSNDAWSSDGRQLQAIPQLITYNRCEKRFN
jgi:hypothetical protein